MTLSLVSMVGEAHLKESQNDLGEEQPHCPGVSGDLIVPRGGVREGGGQADRPAGTELSEAAPWNVLATPALGSAG